MRLIGLLLIGTALFLRADVPDSKKDKPKNPFAGKPEAVEAGRKLFLESCSGCHGPNGEGGRGPNLARGEQVRSKTDLEVFEVVRQGVPGSDMPPSRMPEDDVWRVVSFVRSFSASAYESRAPGDAEAGRKLFFGKAGCSGCHAIQGQGGMLGPDLSNIGRLQSYSQLQEAILEPSVSIAEGYRGATVVTLKGQKITGVARNNTNYSIQLQDAQGNPHLLQKKDLREVIFRKSSLMPSDYKARLSRTEFQDLLSFLGRQALRKEVASSTKEN